MASDCRCHCAHTTHMVQPPAVHSHAGPSRRRTSLTQPVRCVASAGAVDIEDRFEPTICADFTRLCPHAVRKLYGRPDFLWFSPPCTEFSRMNRKKRHERDYETALALVRRCLEFVHILQPSQGFVIENPRGGDLASFPVLATVKRNAFDYCCFGAHPKKPTTLWNDLHHLQDRRCDGHRPESHHASGKHRYKIKDTLRGEAAAVIPSELAERVFEAVCKQAPTSERNLMGDGLSPGLSPFDDGWREQQQRQGACSNPYWRDKNGSLTVPAAQQRQDRELRALAKRIDEQQWRSERIAEICGVFDPVESTMVCWAMWDGVWEPARLCEFSDLPDTGKGPNRTCLDNVLDLSKGEQQMDNKLLVNWLYEGTVSTVPKQNTRRISDKSIGLAKGVTRKKREALRQAKILSSPAFLLKRHELSRLKPGQKLLHQYNGVFQGQVDEHHNEWFELHLVRYVHSEDKTACVWELDSVAVTQSGRQKIVSHHERRGSAAQSCVLEPLDLDEAAAQGRLRRWFDWDDEDNTIGVATITPEATSAEGSEDELDTELEPAETASAEDCTAAPVLSASLLIGLRVRMLFSLSGRHLGTVHQMLGCGKLLVKFDDGESKEYAVAKVRAALVDRLLFQRVCVPFLTGTKRVRRYCGTIMGCRNAKYLVDYDDGEKIDGYAAEDLREHLTGQNASMDEPELDQSKHEARGEEATGREQEMRRRHRLAPKRFEAGPASRSRAEGVRYFVPADPATRKKTQGRQPKQTQEKSHHSQPQSEGENEVPQPATAVAQHDHDLPLDEEGGQDLLSQQEFNPEATADGGIDVAQAGKPRKRPHSHDNRSREAIRLGWGAPKRRRKKKAVATHDGGEQDQVPEQQQGFQSEASPRIEAASAEAAGVQTAIGLLQPGDLVSVRWDDNRWYAASIVYASPSEGIKLLYPESAKWKEHMVVFTDIDADVTPTGMRKVDTLDVATAAATQPALPINFSRIPEAGDRVEVEFDVADDGAAQPDFVVYTGVCIHAQAKAATGSVAAQRLGYASASRMPTRFKVRFDCGAESLIMRGVHRWRRVE